MEEENSSKFYDTIVAVPVSISLLNDSTGSIFEPGFECSTPNVSNSILKRHACKRKFCNEDNVQKLRKLEKDEVQNDLESSQTSNEDDTLLENSKIQNSSFSSDIKCVGTVNSKINSEPQNNAPVIVREIEAIEDAKNQCNSAVLTTECHLPELEDEQSTSHSQSSIPSISLGLSIDNDDYLLMSSSDDEDDADLETYYHLLDSPKHSENDNTVLNNSDLSKTMVAHTHQSSKENEKGLIEIVDLTKSDTSETENEELIEAETSQMDPVSKTIQESLTKTSAPTSNDSATSSNSQIKSKRFVPRSQALKRYIKDYQFEQQQRYPAWLEKAKNSCSHHELVNLMQTIYEPTTYDNRGRFVLENLTIKNYRNALLYCGKNPNKIPPNVMSSDFYFTSPKNTFKRFAQQ